MPRGARRRKTVALRLKPPVLVAGIALGGRGPYIDTVDARGGAKKRACLRTWRNAAAIGPLVTPLKAARLRARRGASQQIGQRIHGLETLEPMNHFKAGIDAGKWQAG